MENQKKNFMKINRWLMMMENHPLMEELVVEKWWVMVGDWWLVRVVNGGEW